MVTCDFQGCGRGTPKSKHVSKVSFGSKLFVKAIDRRVEQKKLQTVQLLARASLTSFLSVCACSELFGETAQLRLVKFALLATRQKSKSQELGREMRKFHSFL